jgi:hypothetical protein
VIMRKLRLASLPWLGGRRGVPAFGRPENRYSGIGMSDFPIIGVSEHPGKMISVRIGGCEILEEFARFFAERIICETNYEGYYPDTLAYLPDTSWPFSL